jgi:hypothetical protein
MEEREGYSSTLTQTWRWKGMGGQHHSPAALPPEKRTGPHCTGHWVGSGLVWMGPENLNSTGVLNPNGSSPERVALPTGLSRQQMQ